MEFIDSAVAETFPDYDVTYAGEVWDRKHRCYVNSFVKCNGTYPYVRIKDKTGECRDVRVVDLVYEAFHGKMPKGRKIGYKDGNRMNNTAYNLTHVPKRKISKTEMYRSRPIKIVETGEVFSSIYECAEVTGIRVTSLKRCVDNNVVRLHDGRNVVWAD